MRLIEKKSVNEEHFEFEEHTYYLVEAAFKSTNPVAKYILYTGFVSCNKPCGYNSIISNGDKVGQYSSLHYLKVLSKLATVR